MKVTINKILLSTAGNGDNNPIHYDEKEANKIHKQLNTGKTGIIIPGNLGISMLEKKLISMNYHLNHLRVQFKGIAVEDDYLMYKDKKIICNTNTYLKFAFNKKKPKINLEKKHIFPITEFKVNERILSCYLQSIELLKKDYFSKFRGYSPLFLANFIPALFIKIAKPDFIYTFASEDLFFNQEIKNTSEKYKFSYRKIAEKKLKGNIIETQEFAIYNNTYQILTGIIKTNKIPKDF